MIAIATLCLHIAIAIGLQNSDTSLEISYFTFSSLPSSLLSSTSTDQYCGDSCGGIIDVLVSYTGTKVVVDPAGTTGPPNCDTRATALGAGYANPQTTSFFAGQLQFQYAFEDGYMPNQWPITENTILSSTIIGKNLVRFNASNIYFTIACLGVVDSPIYGYFSEGGSQSSGFCLPTAKYVALSSPITYRHEDFFSTNNYFMSSYLVDSLLLQLGTTTCNSVVMSTSDSGCRSSTWAGMPVQGVWQGIPLTYDPAKVTTAPNCATPLKYLGPGYTGSNTYTTLTYDAGGIGLGMGTNMFADIAPPQITGGPDIWGQLIKVDSQTIGCWTLLHYLVQSYEVMTGYESCSGSAWTWREIRNITIKEPVTATGELPFLTTENGQVSLIPSLRNQLTTIPNPTAFMPSAIMSMSAETSSPSSILILLDGPNSELSHATKVVFAITMGLAFGMIFILITFFIWQHRCSRRSQKNRKIRASSALDRPQSRGNHKKTPKTSLLKSTASQQQQSWRAPLVMIIGLISGFCFALGHHFFYNWASLQRVDEVNISQSWILRLGNFLAFAVKLSLSVSIGVAFIQLQWTKLRRQPLRIKDVDTLSGILTDIINFSNGLLWFKYPGLLLIAVVYWLLPIVPVFTPGTITVVPGEFETLAHLQVPQLDINASVWTESYGDGGRVRGTITLDRIAMASSTLGEILPLRFNYTNATYSLEFLGPAVQCRAVNETTTLNTTELLALGDEYNTDGFMYFSWVAGENVGNPDISHCGNDNNNLDTASADRARLYIMTNNGNTLTGFRDLEGQPQYNLTECSLYNATYSADFHFNNTLQTVTVRDVEYLHGVVVAEDEAHSDTEYKNQANAYAGLMAVFGSLLVGSIQRSPYGSVTLTENCTSIRYIDPGLNLSQANIDADAVHTQNITVDAVRLRGILEEVFQNITLSLLSNDAFLKDPSTADFIPVNMTMILSTYSYNSFELVVIYAVGLLVTLACCLVGCYNFWLNQGSYQNIFSTFIRAIQQSELAIDGADDGADPCPPTIQRTLVNFTSIKTSGVQSSSDPAKQHLISRKPVQQPSRR